MNPTAVDVLRTKRDGGALSTEEIRWIVRGYTAGDVAEEQMSALLMAIYLNGMTPAETADWTAAMIDSGTRLDLSGVDRPVVDKHSTGGVGDKTSLVLAPLLAACGAAVPMVSGRGLGHTGGTLDKMEAIRGWSPTLSPAAFVEQLRTVGAVICAASDDLAPADRKLYALRDVTATVESIPMIAASILSKKIAEGTRHLVLDVKVGTGAFLTQRSRATELARTMVDLGTAHGVATTAVLSAMSVPLGRAAGNAVEVAEAVEVLAGGGPPDLVELVLTLAREMAQLAGVARDPAEVLARGAAMDVWRAMVRGQGGDPDAPLPQPREREVLTADVDGVVSDLDALAVGRAAWQLGAGRTRKEDPVQPAAGVLCLAKPGDQVQRGQPLFELHSDDASRLPAAVKQLRPAITLTAPGSSGSSTAPSPIVLDILRSS